MENYGGFCRQRLRAGFLWRRMYPLGSQDRARSFQEARSFLRAYRAEMVRLGRQQARIRPVVATPNIGDDPPLVPPIAAVQPLTPFTHDNVLIMREMRSNQGGSD